VHQTDAPSTVESNFCCDAMPLGDSQLEVYRAAVQALILVAHPDGSVAISSLSGAYTLVPRPGSRLSLIASTGRSCGVSVATDHEPQRNPA